MELTFLAGLANGAMQCLNIGIVDDAVLERDEIFTVTLTSDAGVILGNSITTIIIAGKYINTTTSNS